MARSPFQYRASEPGQLESELALGALKPETSGMALAMLPGAASIRQDIGAASGRAYERDALLAEMTQRQTAKHQDDSTALGIYQLQNPGMVEAAMQTGRFRDLFSGSSPSVGALTQMLTQGQFRMQDANIQDKYADALQKGVVSGYTTPTGTAEEQMGHPIERVDPLQKQIELMKEGAATRRLGMQLAKENQATYSPKIVPNASGEGTHVEVVGSGVPLAAFPGHLKTLVQLAANPTPPVYQGGGQPPTVGDVETAPLPEPTRWTTNRSGQKTLLPPSQGAAPQQQPMAKTDPGRSGTASTPSTSAAPGTPSSGALFPSVQTTPWTQAPPGYAKVMAGKLYNKLGDPALGLTPMQVKQIKDAYSREEYSIHIGRDNKKYLMIGNTPVIQVSDPR